MFELPAVDRRMLVAALDMGIKIPSEKDLDRRVRDICRLARKTHANAALIDVPPMLVSRLEIALKKAGIAPLHPMGRVQRYAVLCDDFDSDYFGQEIPMARYILQGFVEV